MRWLVFALLVTVSGCKQGAGDRCNVDSDCGDGLICVRPPGGTPQSGGVCQTPGSTTGADMSMPDSGTVPDLSSVDA